MSIFKKLFGGKKSGNDGNEDVLDTDVEINTSPQQDIVPVSYEDTQESFDDFGDIEDDVEYEEIEIYEEIDEFGNSVYLDGNNNIIPKHLYAEYGLDEEEEHSLNYDDGYTEYDEDYTEYGIIDEDEIEEETSIADDVTLFEGVSEIDLDISSDEEEPIELNEYDSNYVEEDSDDIIDLDIDSNYTNEVEEYEEDVIDVDLESEEVDEEDVQITFGNAGLLESNKVSKEELYKELTFEISDKEIETIYDTLQNHTANGELTEVMAELEEKNIPLRYLVALKLVSEEAIHLYRAYKLQDDLATSHISEVQDTEYIIELMEQRGIYEDMVKSRQQNNNTIHNNNSNTSDSSLELEKEYTDVRNNTNSSGKLDEIDKNETALEQIEESQKYNDFLESTMKVSTSEEFNKDGESDLDSVLKNFSRQVDKENRHKEQKSDIITDVVEIEEKPIMEESKETSQEPVKDRAKASDYLQALSDRISDIDKKQQEQENIITEIKPDFDDVEDGNSLTLTEMLQTETDSNDEVETIEFDENFESFESLDTNQIKLPTNVPKKQPKKIFIVCDGIVIPERLGNFELYEVTNFRGLTTFDLDIENTLIVTQSIPSELEDIIDVWLSNKDNDTSRIVTLEGDLAYPHSKVETTIELNEESLTKYYHDFPKFEDKTKVGTFNDISRYFK